MDPQKKKLRWQIAAEAARLLCTGAEGDMHQAKIRAAQSLAGGYRVPLPDNKEVEQEIIVHNQLFGGASYDTELAEKRKAALEAMRYLAEFEPRLTGAVLKGTIRDDSSIQIQLHSNHPDNISARLNSAGISYRQQNKHMTLGRQEFLNLPVLLMVAGDQEIELTILPERGLREPPIQKHSGRKLPRAGIKELEDLLSNPGTNSLPDQRLSIET